MKYQGNYGYVRVEAAGNDVSIADPKANLQAIEAKVEKAIDNGVQLILFPELSLTGYTAGDLFLNKTLLHAAKKALLELRDFSKDKDIVIVVGVPLQLRNSLYNCAAVIVNGEIKGVVPKVNLPNYSEFYEERYFSSYPLKHSEMIDLGDGFNIPFGTDLIFQDEKALDFSFAIEICEDLWIPTSPSSYYAEAGANIILNLSASDELLGKAEIRRTIVCSTSNKEAGAYIYSSSGEGESTSDVVYSGHRLIAECGDLLSESRPFKNQDIITEIDLDRIRDLRRKNSAFHNKTTEDFHYILFSLSFGEPKDGLRRKIDAHPFLMENKAERGDWDQTVLDIQVHGLVQRMKSIHCEHLVVGLSGGLDSSLSLLVACEALKYLHLPVPNLYAITLPALGTSSLTHTDAEILAKNLGCTFLDIDIKKAVDQHFKDIGHDPKILNNTYENAQARERTQILMDFANDHKALMIGTGDLSELCLGWSTYSGDHMSMYNVNCGVPKTLVKEVCAYYADTHPEVHDVLYAIINTPISPELLPTDKNGQIAQKTEDKIGPYELVDFYLYNLLKSNYSLHKIFYMAKAAFHKKYDDEVLYHYLGTFIRRFFSAQFKRNCAPDGIKVTSVAVSPRGDLRLPTDASSSLYLEELEEIGKESGLKA